MDSQLPKIARRKSLTSEVTQELRDAIERGRMKPGTKLPTEAALSTQMEVSRTVVREAVAALKADGLVTTRQGVGAFVAEPGETEHFKVDCEKLGSLRNVLNLLELRIAMEADMAAFAAERWEGDEAEAICEYHEKINKLLEEGKDSVDADFQFHLAIARATHNSYFIDFMRFLGTKTVPSRELVIEEEDKPAYVALINAEHRAIAEAIANRDADAARAAARGHLTNSWNRHAEKARKALD